MGERPQATPRRLVVRSLLRSAASTVLLVVGYYLLPLDPKDFADDTALLWLVLGLVVVVAVLMWQVRAIIAARYPRLRAVEALAVGVPLLLVVFASTYELLEAGDPASFNESLDRTDALYFALTVLATVGFGDIVPVTTPARVATMVQMLLDLAVFGLAAKVIVGAVNVGLRRRAAQEHSDAAEDG
jgi:voltage-gated potassium channel